MPRSRSGSTAAAGSTRPPPISCRPCTSAQRTPAPSCCSASATRGRTSPPKHGTPSRLPRPSTQTSLVRLTDSVGLIRATKATKMTDIKMVIRLNKYHRLRRLLYIISRE
ncbi:hypothetical protein EJB05_21675, partial [Eragrostis curvula]